MMHGGEKSYQPGETLTHPDRAGTAGTDPLQRGLPDWAQHGRDGSVSSRAGIIRARRMGPTKPDRGATPVDVQTGLISRAPAVRCKRFPPSSIPASIGGTRERKH